MPEDGPEKQLLNFADPMCSWCWGFSPVVEALRERFDQEAPMSLVLGGLRPGAQEPLDDKAKAMIRGHWEHVAEMTGQPFDHAFFEREGFRYNTEPACRAAVTVRALLPELAFPYLAELHHAFYAENRDITDREVLAELAVGLGIDKDRFERCFEGDEARAQAQRDFLLSRHLGVSGFPTLIAKRGKEYGVVTVGYRPRKHLEPALSAWLAKAA
ncbi:MAG: DsbA family protein [Sandaracinaceae bacterium]